MSIGFSYAIRGDVSGFAQRNLRAHAEASTIAVQRAALGLKNTLRRQAARSGLGERFGNTMRADIEPPPRSRRYTVNASARVHSKAIVKGRPGGVIDLWRVHDAGGTITVNGASYLWLRVKPGPRTLTPKTYGLNRLRFVKVRRGRGRPGANRVQAFLFDKATNELVFVGLRSVRLRKRVRLERATRGAEQRLVATYARELGRRALRAERAVGRTELLLTVTS